MVDFTEYSNLLRKFELFFEIRIFLCATRNEWSKEATEQCIILELQ